nr:hypothetical protein [Paludisphaera rhizosphaerae]
MKWGVHAIWVIAVVSALRLGLGAFDTNPEHLIGLVALTYLAAWGPFFVFSRHGTGGTLARFALCTGVVGLILTAVELPAYFGLIDYRVVFATPTPSWLRTGNAPDADLIYVREPHEETRFRYDGSELYGLRGATPWRRYVCELSTDEHGFRNPVDFERADVVVIGDSIIEGLHVAAKQLMTARLAELTGRSVANLGRTGYGPQQEAVVAQRFAIPLKPDVCVWAFYEGNDLQDLHEYDANRKSAQHVLDHPRGAATYGRSFVRNGSGFLLRNVIHPSPTRSAEAHAGLFVTAGGQEVRMYFDTGVQHGSGGPEFPRGNSEEVGRVQTILSGVSDLCRENGVALVVAFVPAKLRIYRDLCRFQADSPCPAWPFDELPKDFRSLVEKLGPDVVFVDLTTPMRRAAEGGKLVYLPDDVHWSEEGHQVAAEALASVLASRLGTVRDQVAGEVRRSSSPAR